jgi:hypothetical protein
MKAEKNWYGIIAGSASVCAAFLMGCADSANYDQGGPAISQSGSNTSTRTEATVPNADVAAERNNLGKNESVESRFNTIGSASSPSATVPANVATNESAQAPVGTSSEDSSATPRSNEQGAQASPEPNTGDDANPDHIQPEN